MGVIISRHRSAAVSLLVLIVSATFAFKEVQAQTLYGTLIGNVTDPSSAAIAGAKVAAINTGTGFSREAIDR